MASFSASMKPNRLLRIVNQINSKIPAPLRGPALSLAFNSQIKYAGTTGIAIQQWDETQAVVCLKNRWRVQNHLKGVHATAMATLAESATGMAFGVHVPDTHVPLLKRMTVDFVKRARGNLRAIAHITPEQVQEIRSTDRGSAVISVRVTDEDEKEPIVCEMEWAWTTTAKKKSASDDNGDSPHQRP